MTFRINYNGKYEDSILISGDSIEEIKEKAHSEIEARNWDAKDCWSEEERQ